MIATFNINGFKIGVIGVSHIGFDKKENQDAFNIQYRQNEFIATVADGLGSAELSKEGAKGACKVLSRLFFKKEVVFDRLHALWKKRLGDVDYKKYDTTIKFIGIKNDKIHFGGIGDGALVIAHKSGVESAGDHGLFSNVTNSIGTYKADELFHTDAIPLQECTICLSTDGFSEDFDESAFPSLLREMKSKMELDIRSSSKEIENLLNNWPIKTNGDDKTVVFINVRKQ